jgi:hypothetical protein
MPRTRSASATVALLVAIVWGGLTPALAQRGQKAENLTGEWTLTTPPEGPHGEVSMGLVLKHEGRTVTGTLATPHGDTIALAGEFEKGTLTLAEPSDAGLTMKARLQEDGTLSGYLSSARGDLTWTARRAASRDRR